MPRILALSGGVGGAKLALGLCQQLAPPELSILVNTADDFDHLGLRICPDLDSVIYALAGENDPERGWGLRGETWNFLRALGHLGADEWFSLGDRDLATHVLRTLWLNSGQSLTEVTLELARRLDVQHAVLPVSNQPIATRVETAEGSLAFQHYFVRERCVPVATGFHFSGMETASLTAEIEACLADPLWEGSIICPSNPFVSVEPILQVGGLEARLRAKPLIAVSPIIGGRAIKGPAAKMLVEMGREASVLGVAKHYAGRMDGLLIDEEDAALAPQIEALGLKVHTAPVLMVTAEDRRRLAAACLLFLQRI